MHQFIKVFLEIILWRRGPQDLPASRFLVWITLSAYLLVTVLQLAVLHEPAATWLFFLIVDPLLLMGTVWLVLKLYGRSARFNQTTSAVLGCAALLGLLVYLPLHLFLIGNLSDTNSGAAQLAALFELTLFALVMGRIIERATESSMFTGIAVALTYFFVSISSFGLLQTSGG